ncbi:N-acetylmuramoyl-L-alanine amidase [Blautia liquoris]|uniref:N-acetylmuramoyl-L-alanine amidase n=1 Tax=Blautia liquoris TaxID=2779518 RepID=A0A7M2RDJ1_9FIRM|nr:N-acetylmuramoyl-L-alanine amidase [Blautia liquoris]QOV18034.1 N-acetylmuramoyl-L-alanine amidase [Blautia liquoris]
MAIQVFIDQGHNPSGVNAGAEGFGYREQDITYMVGRYLADIMADDSRFEVMLSRPTPETSLGTSNATSLMERVNMANEWPADYFISIHVNSNPNPAVNGSEVYVYEFDDVASALAEQILLEIVRRTGTKNNGVRENPSLYVLRRTQMPAVLVELGYISNEDDVQKLVNDQYQFAYAIYVGLLNYLELPQIL